MAPGPGVEAALARSRPSMSRIVACARLGEQRAVKLRLDGAGGSVALATRWAPTADGWRATFVELAPGEPAPEKVPDSVASGDPRRPA
jgi:hypothetical protein